MLGKTFQLSLFAIVRWGSSLSILSPRLIFLVILQEGVGCPQDSNPDVLISPCSCMSFFPPTQTVVFVTSHCSLFFSLINVVQLESTMSKHNVCNQVEERKAIWQWLFLPHLMYSFLWKCSSCYFYDCLRLK
jgi:hypothetical protein